MSYNGKKVCLIVIDGWGKSDEVKGNAILEAKTPVMDDFEKKGGIFIEASSLDVGVPEGQMGNSEVGHLNIGAGRVVYQDIVRINMTCQKNCFKDIEILKNSLNSTKRVHLMGLVSDGGVHGHIDHLKNLILTVKNFNIPNCYIHFFGDGRDTKPTSAVNYLDDLIKFTQSNQYGSLSTIIGRFYAMDRDKRSERTRMAYEALVSGVGEKVQLSSVVENIKTKYSLEVPETDEFLKPMIINEEGVVKDDDLIIFFNFRSDRMRQLSQAFFSSPFDDLPKPKAKLLAMTQYDEKVPIPVIFEPMNNKNVLAEVLSTNGLKQMHIAETEKYAHVTFFFNGGRELIFENEERILVHSPKVRSYDQIPKMSMYEVTEKVIESIETNKFNFVMCNFAPPDMVGHTGCYKETVEACEHTDICIGKIKEVCEKNDYILMITADHGNAEKMIDEQGGPLTAHTCNPVPLFITGGYTLNPSNLPNGRKPALCDVAPTILKLMNLTKPKEMDGEPLL